MRTRIGRALALAGCTAMVGLIVALPVPALDVSGGQNQKATSPSLAGTTDIKLGTKCWCCPRVFITTDPLCNCTLQISLQISQIGYCDWDHSCPHTSTLCVEVVKRRICTFDGDASEVNCNSNFQTHIHFQEPCGDPGVPTTTIPCGDGTGNHVVTFQCDDCTCPQQTSCTPPP